MSTSRAHLEQLVSRLGAAFRARGMEGHRKSLAVFWLALRKGLLEQRRDRLLEVRWSEQHVIEWMETLQLPPYERALPVQPKGAPCPACAPEPGQVSSRRTELVFDRGARLRCDRCGLRWLELD